MTAHDERFVFALAVTDENEPVAVPAWIHSWSSGDVLTKSTQESTIQSVSLHAA